jgi:hypothetical protein
MTLGVFWQRLEVAVGDCGGCHMCPVKEYANETNTERMCDKVCDCADGLMMLHKVLQSEERQKMECDEDARHNNVSRE